MKYPMTFDVVQGLSYPYRFSFDLVNGGPLPKDQIPDLKNTVNAWLKEADIEYVYSAGLFWSLKNEQDAIMFRLKFA